MNGLADNVIGETDTDHLAGNHIVMDIGDGHYVMMAHLRKGSALVVSGDVVRAGQPIANCGNSGNTSQPHLHLQVQNQPDAFAPGAKTYPILFRDVTCVRAKRPREDAPFFVRRNDILISEPPSATNTALVSTDQADSWKQKPPVPAPATGLSASTAAGHPSIERNPEVLGILDWLKIQPLDGWLSDLQSDDQKVQKMAERAIGAMGTHLMPEILKVLRETNDEPVLIDTRHFNAAKALKFMGPGVKDSLPDFAALLKSGNKQRAYAGAAALGYCAPAVPQAFSILTNCLTEAAPDVKSAAMYGVGACLQMEPPSDANRFAEPALPLLLRNLKDKVDYVRSDATVELAFYTQHQCSRGQPVPTDLLTAPLMELLLDNNSHVRQNALYALDCWCFTDTLKPWIPDVQKLLEDPDDGVRRSTTNLLKRLNALPATNAIEHSGVTPALSVEASGTEPLSFQWVLDPTNIAPSDTNVPPR